MTGVLPGFFGLLAWAIFLGATALSITLGVIMSFHWFRYARNPQSAFFSTVVYGIGCLIILVLLLGAVTSAT
ncbi:MAG: hypothetical protein WAZ27_03925 [Minisyncoccia bacterium]